MWPGSTPLDGVPANHQTSSRTSNFTVSPNRPGAMPRDLSALRWLDGGELVILYGPGSGTHVVQANLPSVSLRAGSDGGQLGHRRVV